MSDKNKSFFKKAVRVIKDYIWIIIGSLITAAALNIFLVPYKIAPGGVSGIATVVYYLSGGRFMVGATMFVLNVPLFLLGFKFIGKRFVFKTLFSAVFLSAAIDISEPYTSGIVKNIISSRDGYQVSPDLLLYSLFGGVFLGMGLGLVFKSGATTGGTDLAARVVHHFFSHYTMGTLILIIDSLVITLAAVAFESILFGMYAAVALYISSKVIDAILEGVNYAKSVYIISEQAEEIVPQIMDNLDRGVTALKGMGMYTRNDKLVLYCVIKRDQIAALKEIVRKVDPDAFIILADVREVLGEGFKSYE
jgi:uncharacterized membrane-anchored protein YitT (DUF2179 family)